jgi:hypothetical protein
MTDDRLRQAYAQHLAARAPADRAGCVSPEALLALVERKGNETDRLATLDHAMACDACRRDLELLRAVAGAEPAGRARRFPQWITPQLAAAAALVVVLGTAATILLRRGGETEWRGATDIVLVSPAGPLAAGQRLTFTWHTVAGATRYDVEILTATGDSVYTGLTVDTTLVLPSGVRLTEGREYLWSVRATSSDGSQATSTARRFRLMPP